MIVKEHIFEKFKEEGDPIRQMGIGHKEEYDFSKQKKNMVHTHINNFKR